MATSTVVTRNTILDCDTMRDNIITMLRRDMAVATVQREWYRRANHWTNRLSRVSGYSAVIVASVTAVLSPSVDWRDNRRMVLALLRDPSAITFRNRIGNVVALVGYGANITKARNILRHNDPSQCRGPKVVAFRDAILGTRDYAVVDVHATNVAMGTIGTYSGPGAFLHNIAMAYEAAAYVMGWQVHEVQAATWVIYKASK